MDGLSPEKLRVLLHPVTHPPGGRYVFDGVSLSRESEHAADVVLWETRDSTGKFVDEIFIMGGFIIN